MWLWARRTIIALLLVAAAVAAYVATVLLSARGGLPELAGELAIDGPTAAVEIVRDRHAVPHIFALSERDAHFALGFVHAQDRLWQMMFNRQRLEGRLAEWMGPPALASDIVHREFFYPAHVAEAQWAALPPSTRRHLQAYADGVNAYLDAEIYERPPEMRILHVHPERWRAKDALVMWSQMYSLLIAPGPETRDARIRRYAVADYADELFVLHDDAPPIIDRGPGGSPDSGSPVDGGAEAVGESSADPVVRGIESPVSFVKRGAFSNGWTVSGAHTVSGKPLLANDPQLPSTSPSVWYLAHVSVAGRSVVGASVPGAPGIVVGRTDGLAWGVTNAGIDAADFAFVELADGDPRQYRSGPGKPWQRFEVEPQVYRVRFGSDVERPLRVAGASVVFPADQSATPFEPDGSAALFRSIGWWPGHSLPALLALNRAQTVEQGLAAARGFVAPAINLSLADTAGRIAYFTAGRLPNRPPEHARSIGFAPDDDNEWDGLVPASENPSVVDPASGRIVSANQIIVDDAYPHYLGGLWAPPYRAERIHEMLDADDRHDTASFVRMQSDTLSPPARNLLPMMLATVPDETADGELLDILRDWDGRFELDHAAPAIFLTWLERFQRAAVHDELGPGLAARYRDWPMFALIERILAGERARWCDDVTTPGVRETCPELLARTLGETRRALAEAFGSDARQWRWRTAADFTHPHLGFAGMPLLDGWFSRRSDVAGGPESAFIHSVAAGTAPRFSRHAFASSLQLVFDLADLDASRYVISGGQSGHFRSPHYDDLLALWERGERITIPTRREDIDSRALLRLAPRLE